MKFCFLRRIDVKTREAALKYGLSLPDTYRDTPFKDTNWVLVRYRENKKAFLWTYELDGNICINVKTEPDKAYFQRQMYAGIKPGYHQNKDHWNTIVLDGSVPDKVIKQMIAESYDLISDTPTKRIYEAVKKIPGGRVATYGQIALLAGNPRASRVVGYALHVNPKPGVIPCHRVVNREGRLAPSFAFGGTDAQQRLLEAEGVQIEDGTVSLKRYGWDSSAVLIP